jgi:excisionase family DNA binding protein
MVNKFDIRSPVEETIQIQLLKGDDVAKILNISLPFAYQLMRQGEIPTVRMGRSVRVRRQDLERFISNSLAEMSDFRTSNP